MNLHNHLQARNKKGTVMTWLLILAIIGLTLVLGVIFLELLIRWVSLGRVQTAAKEAALVYTRDIVRLRDNALSQLNTKDVSFHQAGIPYSCGPNATGQCTALAGSAASVPGAVSMEYLNASRTLLYNVWGKKISDPKEVDTVQQHQCYRPFADSRFAKIHSQAAQCSVANKIISPMMDLSWDFQANPYGSGCCCPSGSTTDAQKDFCVEVSVKGRMDPVMAGALPFLNGQGIFSSMDAVKFITVGDFDVRARAVANTMKSQESTGDSQNGLAGNLSGETIQIENIPKGLTCPAAPAQITPNGNPIVTPTASSLSVPPLDPLPPGEPFIGDPSILDPGQLPPPNPDPQCPSGMRLSFVINRSSFEASFVCQPGGGCGMACASNGDCQVSDIGRTHGCHTCRAGHCAAEISCGGQCTSDTDCAGSVLCGKCINHSCRSEGACGAECEDASDCAGGHGCNACIGKVCRSGNGCGKPCTNGSGCAGSDGCNACVQGTCQSDPSGGCGKACTNDGGCASGGEGSCNKCISGTCRKDPNPGCGIPCTSDGGCVDGGANGCNKCLSGTCRKDPNPGCGKACTNDGGCASGGEGSCNKCISGTCRKDPNPGCGTPCTSDGGCVGGGANGCNKCSNTEKICVSSGGCGKPCTGDGSCAGSSDGCTECIDGVCKTGGGGCGKPCTGDGSCAGSSDGCTECIDGVCKTGGGGCGAPCTGDGSCAGSSDGCSKCLNGICKSAGGCGSPCTGNGACAGGANGCTECIDGVCKTGGGGCGKPCTSIGDCAGADSGCNACIQGSCSVSKCNGACSTSADCAGGSHGCNICDGGTCKSGGCGAPCEFSGDCSGAASGAGGDSCSSCVNGTCQPGNCGRVCTNDGACAGGSANSCTACLNGVCQRPCGPNTLKGQECGCVSNAPCQCGCDPTCGVGCGVISLRDGASPILITLDGAKPKVTMKTYFDLTGEFKGVTNSPFLASYVRTSAIPQIYWPEFSSNVGWLAYDFNGNGKIDDGTELFGSSTSNHDYGNGYEALSNLFDKNADGVVSGQEIKGLLLWSDLNHDGVSQKAELRSLKALGISSIDVKKSLQYERQAQEGGYIYPYSKQGVTVKTNNNKIYKVSSYDLWLMEVK